MPIYEYRCTDCGRRFEKLIRSAGSPPPACPECRSTVPERLVSLFGAVGQCAPAASGFG